MATKKFCVIGLGHFGLNLALDLTGHGAEVLAIDNSQDRVDLVSDKVTYAVCMDATDKKALEGFALQDMDAVIVAIGEGFESSIMTSAILQEIGVKKIYNRVISPVHERLLKLMQVDELLVPEVYAAKELTSRLMIPGLLESFLIDKDHGIFEINAPSKFLNKKLIDLKIREKYKLNLVTIKREKSKKGLLSLGQKGGSKVIGVPGPDTEFIEGDVLVLFGREKDVRELLEK